jgi:hypothetical protein
MNDRFDELTTEVNDALSRDSNDGVGKLLADSEDRKIKKFQNLKSLRYSDTPSLTQMVEGYLQSKGFEACLITLLLRVEEDLRLIAQSLQRDGIGLVDVITLLDSSLQDDGEKS